MSALLKNLATAASQIPDLADRGAELVTRGAELAPDSLLYALGLQRRPSFGQRFMSGVGFLGLSVVAGAGLMVGINWLRGNSPAAKKTRAQVQNMVDDVLEH